MGTIGPVPFAQLPASGLPGDIFANPSYWTTSPADAYNGAYNSNQYNVSYFDIVNAGYAMGQVKIGNLRFLTGVRKEFTQNTGGAPVLVASTAALNNTYDATKSAAENAQRALSRIRGWRWATNKYSTNLPGAHMVYDDAVHGLQFRTSFNTSISRPVATTLLPTATVNDVSKTMHDRQSTVEAVDRAQLRGDGVQVFRPQLRGRARSRPPTSRSTSRITTPASRRPTPPPRSSGWATSTRAMRSRRTAISAT
jgi:hypothetical protein